ncbi:MAG: hypothetical protein HN846_00395 [Candidatus Pacebacteria bacterium]|jgi:predicted AlkP superfamily phosphohydrolase/phosphomutase|nr:hypothetical protein [Candidatus Paceibacterota bacterium]MBT4004450.1 hypothetical protein [Candidatus Paceibacterota bacterium]MBT4358562.1 hypothetical protein [Candidatus Paceibacterota bacterium]MBT4680502.1 hypothetical protein [Candidatus Paceibacterota bacterium]MBT6898837.1 hypothetical protein [Candidatus Paceibacterota bacterium]
MAKVVFLGVDGATLDVVKPLIKNGDLPNFKRLLKSKYLKKLRSTYPPSSPPAWNSIFTGVNPGKHGIYDFVKRKHNSYFIEPVFSEDRKAPFIWEIPSMKKKKTIALSIPFAYPPRKLNGIMTTGLGSPSKESDFTYPADFKKYITENYPDFDIDFEEHFFDFHNESEKALDKIYEVTTAQFELAKDLFTNRKWDFLTIVFRSTDVIQHYFFNNKKIIKRYYQQMDNVVGWFMDHVDRDTYLITASDHGFREVRTKFLINNWLKSQGYLNLQAPNEKESFTKIIDAGVIEKILFKLGFKKIIWLIKRSPLLEFVAKHFLKSARTNYFFNIDWEDTKAYFLSSFLYVNQKSREPSGIVSESEKNKLLLELKRKLMKLSHKGKPAIKKILLSDQIYTAQTEHTPDMIIIPNDHIFVSGEVNHEPQFFQKELNRNGEHAVDGLISVYHKNSQRMTKFISKKNLSLYDIAPSVLKMLKVKLSSEFDGSPLI